MPDLLTSPHACQCEACCPENPSPTYTRQHLRECLVRDIVGRSERKGFFVLFEKHHGTEAAQALAAAVRDELNRRRDADGN